MFVEIQVFRDVVLCKVTSYWYFHLQGQAGSSRDIAEARH
jgi:hypothetical protein